MDYIIKQGTLETKEGRVSESAIWNQTSAVVILIASRDPEEKNRRS